MTGTVPPNNFRVSLDFSGPICSSLTCVQYDFFDQSYGDSPYMDVRYAGNLDRAFAGVIRELEGESLMYYNNYAELANIAFTRQDRMGQLCFIGDVSLNSFRLGAWSSSRTTSFFIFDVNGTSLFSSGTIAVSAAVSSVFVGPWTSSRGSKGRVVFCKKLFKYLQFVFNWLICTMLEFRR